MKVAKERPILFSAPMVRAILEGRKTQTRRVVKFGGQGMPQSVSPSSSIEEDLASPYAKNVRVEHGHIVCDWMGGRFSTLVKCPYGKPGDRLWVRETFGIADRGGRLCDPYVNYRADGAQRPLEDRLDLGWGIVGNQYGGSCDELMSIKDGWRPSIFMPRWASRITLEITEVHVERLQVITEQDIVAEGVDVPRCPYCSYSRADCQIHFDHGICNRKNGPQPDGANQPVSGLPTWIALWNKINGKRAPWDSNPWVWCVSFKRLAI